MHQPAKTGSSFKNAPSTGEVPAEVLKSIIRTVPKYASRAIQRMTDDAHTIRIALMKSASEPAIESFESSFELDGESHRNLLHRQAVQRAYEENFPRSTNRSKPIENVKRGKAFV